MLFCTSGGGAKAPCISSCCNARETPNSQIQIVGGGGALAESVHGTVRVKV